MVNLKDKIIFTHGDYKIRKSAQDDRVNLKIMEINKDGTFEFQVKEKLKGYILIMR